MIKLKELDSDLKQLLFHKGTKIQIHPCSMTAFVSVQIFLLPCVNPIESGV